VAGEAGAEDVSVAIGRCRAGHAPIRWALTAKRRPIPLDPDPSPAGTMLITEVAGEDIATVWKPVDRECPPDVLYVVHFATCPDRGRSGKDVVRRALQRTLARAREGL
jgi:hypothetical protein